MPHFNVKTPRFYPLKNLEIDTKYELGGEGTMTTTAYGEQHFTGDFVNSLAKFNPYKSKSLHTRPEGPYGVVEKVVLSYATGQYTGITSFSASADSMGFNYFGICGHTLAEANAMIRIVGLQKIPDGSGGWTEATDILVCTELFNCSKVSSNGDHWFVPTNVNVDTISADSDTLSDGSFMFKVDPDSAAEGYTRFFQIEIEPIDATLGFTADIEIGSFVWGRYYDMPHSPDLQYSMKMAYDGVKSKKTVGGSTITNVSHYGNIGFCGKFEGFGREGSSNAMTGRRSWKLKFSSLKSNWQENYDDTTGYLFPNTHLSNSEWRYGNDFTYRVLEVTLGGQLPFIWEFDTTVLEEDPGVTFWTAGEHNEASFVVARFPKNSMSFKHTSHKMFDVSMDIEESW